MSLNANFVINVVLGFLFGFYISVLGFPISTWQFWVFMLFIVAFILNGFWA